MMTPMMLDPWHFTVWMTGAAVWIVIAMALLALFALATWQAVVATRSTARQLSRIWLGYADRDYECTIAEAWCFAFWHDGLFKCGLRK